MWPIKELWVCIGRQPMNQDGLSLAAVCQHELSAPSPTVKWAKNSLTRRQNVTNSHPRWPSARAFNNFFSALQGHRPAFQGHTVHQWRCGPRVLVHKSLQPAATRWISIYPSLSNVSVVWHLPAWVMTFGRRRKGASLWLASAGLTWCFNSIVDLAAYQNDDASH